MRGKYRQIFLRVSDDNVDTSTSMNVAVSLERTIEVFVEDVRASLAFFYSSQLMPFAAQTASITAA